MFGRPKGRTELIIGGSGPKFCAQRHGNVRFRVAPQKPGEHAEKREFETEQIVSKSCFGVET